MIALTATATTETRLQIVKTLEMKNPALIVDIPNRQNIAYGVQVITPNPSVTFGKMVSDLQVQKTSYERTIIYCPTKKLTTHLYGFFQAELSEHIYADESQDPKKRIVEMFQSRSDELNKEEILKSLGDSNGCIRVLIATIAYGMGIDCKDVKTVLYYGPSYNCETYLQESGRAGRKGQDQCKSVILYSNIMTKHCHESMVTYLKQKDEKFFWRSLMWTSQNCLHVNIHTSVVMFVKNNANVMVMLATLCFLIQNVLIRLKVKQKTELSLRNK